MKTIEQYLKDNHFTAIETLNGGYCLDGRGGNLYTRLLNAMEEMIIDAYNEGIDAASQRAYNFIEFYQEDKGTMEAIKESILKLKK